MSYTINPNAKNKWARNAENTMDLSLETDASSVYLDNGRTLEQELGEGSMVSNVATVDSSMSKVIDGTLDGAYESCVFKGKSLVNLMTSCKDEYVVRYHNPSNPEHTVANISMMKPNTEYTLFYKAKYRLQGDGAGEQGTLLIATSVEQGFIGTSQKLTTEYKQYVFKLTTTSTVDCFTFKSNGSYFAIKECVLLEGNYTNQDIPFFEGICDVKMPILRNVGKNLFNINQPHDHAFSSPQKYFIENNKLHFIGAKNHENLCWLIKVSKGERIYCSCLEENNKGKIDVRFFSEKRVSSNFTNRSSWDCDGTIKSTICSDEWMLLMLNTGSDSAGDFVFTNIIVSYYDTTYEDHKSNILHTPEIVTLRSLPNGVRDELNLKTGEYIKRIGEIVLEGSSSEKWEVSGLSSDGTKAGFYILSSNITPQPKVSSVTVNNKLPLLPEGAWGSKSHEGCFIGSNALAIVVNTSKLLTPDIGGIRTYLQSNPITMQYELATPITTTIESLSIPFAYENGHIILESGYEGQSLLPTLEYSTVINRTGLIQSIANTVQKQEKQITKLEQMLIQNIIDLDYNNTLLTLKNEMEEML